VGNEDYDVTLEAVDTRVRVTCTCPHFYDNAVVCKHIWAAILAAEADALPVIGARDVGESDLERLLS
jgi:uncharacterized Zn finger protein